MGKLQTKKIAGEMVDLLNDWSGIMDLSDSEFRAFWDAHMRGKHAKVKIQGRYGKKEPSHTLEELLDMENSDDFRRAFISCMRKNEVLVTPDLPLAIHGPGAKRIKNRGILELGNLGDDVIGCAAPSRGAVQGFGGLMDLDSGTFLAYLGNHMKNGKVRCVPGIRGGGAPALTTERLLSLVKNAES